MVQFCVNTCYIYGPSEVLKQFQDRLLLVATQQNVLSVQLLDEFFFIEEESYKVISINPNLLVVSFVTRTQPPMQVLSEWITKNPNTQCRINFSMPNNRDGIWIAQSNYQGKYYEKSMDWQEPVPTGDGQQFQILTEEISRATSAMSLSEEVVPDSIHF